MTRTKTLSAVFAAVLVVLAGGAAMTLAASSGGSGTNAAMQDETTTVSGNETTAVGVNETTVDANETTVGVTETTAVEETTAQAEETTNATGLQSFNVSGLNAPNTAAVGDTITVSANVTNPNEQEDTQPVEFRLDGDVIDRQNVTLGANETQNVTFEVDTTDLQPGLHIHGILTEDFGQLDQITLLREPMTTTPGDNVTTTPGDNVTTTEVVDNETTTEVVETTEVVNETTTEEVVNETTTEVVDETTEPVETTTEEPVVETTTEEPAVETTTEAPEERVEQLVFKVEQVQIDEWSFIIGDSETPDRTEVIEGVDIRDRTQRINLTQLMMEDGSIEDAMENETGDDFETITTPSAEDRELPSDLETVRVVIRDVTIQNVTFIVEVPPQAELPEVPETITPEEPEETTEVVGTETEVPVETTEEGVETTTAVVNETTVAVNETTTAVGNETTAVDGTPTEEPTANVTFEDQESNGSAVVVDSVTMSDGGFVTIHNRSLLEGDALGSVVGSSEYLEAGTHENVTVELNQTLNETQTLIAMPHLDTNGNQQYDFVESGGAEDGPYLDADGEPVVDPAVVRIGAAAETTTAGNETTVAANETTAAVNETTEAAMETTAVEETTAAEGTETTEDGVETTEADDGMTTPDGELQSFTVDNLTAPETVNIGDTLMVSANVTNPSDEESTQRVEFRIDGDLVDRQNVTLGPNETQNVTFEVDTTGAEPGIYVHGVLTDQFGELGLVTLQEGVDGAEETTAEAEETTEAAETTVEDDGNATEVAGDTTTAADETTDEEGVTTDEADGNETEETTTEEV